MKAVAIIAILAVGSLATFVPPPPMGAPQDFIGCTACKAGFKLIEDLVSSNATEEILSQILGAFCNLMPQPQKTACHTVITTDLKAVIEMVKTVETPKEICCQLGACNAPCPVVDPGCEMCKFAVTDIETWIEKGKGKEEIEEVLDAWCVLLPNASKGICKTIADIGIGALIDIIIKIENPKEVCEQITLCNATAPTMAAKPHVPHTPHHGPHGHHGHHGHHGFHMPPPPAFHMPLHNVKSDAGCQWCKIGFGTLEQIVTLNISEVYTEKVLGFFCNFLPQPYSGACHTVILNDLKEVIRVIDSVESPEEICCQVNACDKPCPARNPGCKVCELVLSDLQRWVDEGKGKKEIEELVDAWCLLLPQTDQGICQVITDLGVDAVIETIEKYETPKKACVQMTICNASDPETAKKPAQKPIEMPAMAKELAASAGCDWCKIGFSILERLALSNATEKIAEWAIGYVCNLMPDPYKTACHNVVDADLEELIEMVKTVETPEEICCQVGACTEQCPVVDVPCTMCNYIMTDIARWVKEGKGKDEIEKLIDSWCLLLPESAKPVCQKITDTDIGILIDMVLKYEEPKRVCYEMTLCNNTAF